MTNGLVCLVAVLHSKELINVPSFHSPFSSDIYLYFQVGINEEQRRSGGMGDGFAIVV